MTSFLRTSAALILLLATPLGAQDRPVVVELFTSQGCSSCPPADAIFAQLSGRDDVIAIALHVDYWDYIGWKDEFGHPAHAKRQRAYAQAAGRRSIYTPEMIVNGQTDIVGAKAMSLSKAIAEHAKDEKLIDLKVERTGHMVRISAPAAKTQGKYVVHMLRILPKQTSLITRGENHGKTIEYTNVARDWKVLATWDGRGELALEAKAVGDEAVIVLIQSGKVGPILAAARVK